MQNCLLRTLVAMPSATRRSNFTHASGSVREVRVPGRRRQRVFEINRGRVYCHIIGNSRIKTLLNYNMNLTLCKADDDDGISHSLEMLSEVLAFLRKVNKIVEFKFHIRT